MMLGIVRRKVATGGSSASVKFVNFQFSFLLMYLNFASSNSHFVVIVFFLLEGAGFEADSAGGASCKFTPLWLQSKRGCYRSMH